MQRQFQGPCIVHAGSLFCFVFLFKLMELKLTVDGLEKERDFYFSKLRDIELICQEHESENNPVLSKIIDILYATEVSILYHQQMQAALQ